MKYIEMSLQEFYNRFRFRCDLSWINESMLADKNYIVRISLDSNLYELGYPSDIWQIK